MTNLQLIYAIRTIQQDWWDGDVEMNVALSEIRALFGEWEPDACKN